jgi:hypothetical protein
MGSFRQQTPVVYTKHIVIQIAYFPTWIKSFFSQNIRTQFSVAIPWFKGDPQQNFTLLVTHSSKGVWIFPKRL